MSIHVGNHVGIYVGILYIYIILFT